MTKQINKFKIIKIVILSLLGIIVIGTAVMFIVHHIMLSNELKMLDDAGYYCPVSVGDYNLNVCSYGAENPKHTLVGISGRGVHNYSLTLRTVTDKLSDDNRIVFVDRAGYGLSDDTKVEQTAERIVEDYRTALKNAGISPPYVLLPHSIGSIYATLWASKYPDEIEGIVYLDGTELIDEEQCFDEDDISFLDYIELFGCKLGFQRLFYTSFDPYAFTQSTKETQAIDKALTWKNAYTNALISEYELSNANCRYVFENIVKTDIPKVFIASTGAVQTKEDVIEYYNYIYEQQQKLGIDTQNSELSDEVIEAFIKSSEDFRNEYVYPFTESIGNCKVELLVGDHYIYIQKPDECLAIIEDFLADIE